jgi:hypothetical protein
MQFVASLCASDRKPPAIKAMLDGTRMDSDQKEDKNNAKSKTLTCNPVGSVL